MVAIEKTRERNRRSGMIASSFMQRSIEDEGDQADGADDVAGDRAGEVPAPGAALFCDEQERERASR